jgi:hypothetical protein
MCGTAVIPYSRAEKERDDVRQLAQMSQRKERKRKEGKAVFEGNDVSKTDEFAAAARPKLSVGYHYSRERGTCRQTIREQPSLKFTAETLASTRSQARGIN